jgi:hypothetical protein
VPALDLFFLVTELGALVLCGLAIRRDLRARRRQRGAHLSRARVVQRG